MDKLDSPFRALRQTFYDDIKEFYEYECADYSVEIEEIVGQFIKTCEFFAGRPIQIQIGR